VIEGNYQNAVMRRTLSVNDRYIRGFCLPDYASKATEEEAPVQAVKTGIPQLSHGAKGDTVKAMQILILGYGFTMEGYGADGSFGGATERALKKYQAANSLEADGSCGPKTWAKLLGIS
jgi:peptidoglycan hydrolase-like protein with peptidoglycan-binding domain